MLLTVTTDGGIPAVTALLVVGLVAAATVALIALLVQHRGEVALDRRSRGTPAVAGAAGRARRRVRTLAAVALVDLWALGLGVLVLSAAAAGSPLVVGVVYGVLGCATAGTVVLVLGSLLPHADTGAEPVVPSGQRPGPGAGGQASSPRVLAAVPLPGDDEPAPGTSGAGGRSGSRERAAGRARRREEVEHHRGRQRREAVTAVETVLGRARPGARPARGPAGATSSGPTGPLAARPPADRALPVRPARDEPGPGSTDESARPEHKVTG